MCSSSSDLKDALTHGYSLKGEWASFLHAHVNITMNMYAWTYQASGHLLNFRLTSSNNHFMHWQIRTVVPVIHTAHNIAASTYRQTYTGEQEHSPRPSDQSSLISSKANNGRGSRGSVGKVIIVFSYTTPLTPLGSLLHTHFVFVCVCVE